MGFVRKFILLAIAIYFILFVVSTYKLFAPRLCRKSGTKCFYPLFQSKELVDLYLYFTPKEDLQIHELGKGKDAKLVYSRTNFFLQDSFKRVVVLPTTLSDLLRKNRSMYAHSVLVKHGMSSFPSGYTQPRTNFIEVLHASSYLTKYKEPSREELNHLLSNNRSTITNGRLSYAISLPLKKSVFVELGTLMNLCLAGFAALSFIQPSLFYAAARVSMLASLFPIYREIEKRSLVEHELADVYGMGRHSSSKNTMHLRPTLPIRITADDNEYSSLPLLYLKMNFKGQKNVYSAVRYEKLKLRSPTSEWKSFYKPYFFVDDAFTLTRHHTEIDQNSSIELKILLDYSTVGRLHFSVIQMFKEMLKMYESYGFSERDIDEMKWLFIRRPLHIVVAMQVITLIQFALSMLAFKNDIAFFQGRADFAGLSSRSLITDAIQSWIIFLYIYDYKDASHIILLQLFVAAIIDTWKVSKRLHMYTYWKYGLPWINWKRSDMSSGEQRTEDIDVMGMRYLKYVLYPLSTCWGLYCVYYYKYKSWWSWLISSLADFAYTFGFVNMCPQLFINYKLKSVAHMPWRVLIYKAFNTFIDDIFAWWIMADYTIFLLFLYQRYLYPVDSTRPDEFGYVYVDSSSQTTSAIRIQRLFRRNRNPTLKKIKPE